MAGLIPGVQLGKRYKMSMSPAPHHLVSFQYRFKPPVDEGVDAKVNVDSLTGRWGVRFRAGLSRSGLRATHTDEFFEGTRTQSTGESLLVWQPRSEDGDGDGDGEFIVESVATPVHLHHIVLDADGQNSTKTTVTARLGGKHPEARTTEARFQQLIKGKKRPVGRPRKAAAEPVVAAAVRRGGGTSTSTESTQRSAAAAADGDAGQRSAGKTSEAEVIATFSDDEDLFGDSVSDGSGAAGSGNQAAPAAVEVKRKR